MFFYLVFNFEGFLVHLVPSGSPFALSPFIALLEVISCLIRPVSLSVRLISNIIAGHLLLGLIGSFCINHINGSFVGITLSVLELGVCVIQSYVFVVLCILYSLEIHYE
jgi:ATP synthase subunit 6